MTHVLPALSIRPRSMDDSHSTRHEACAAMAAVMTSGWSPQMTIDPFSMARPPSHGSAMTSSPDSSLTCASSENSCPSRLESRLNSGMPEMTGSATNRIS